MINSFFTKRQNFIKYLASMIAMFILSASSTVFAQTGSVSGAVTNAAGEPMPGVIVLIKGSSAGVVTDMDGKYSLRQVPASATLTFSYVDHITQEVAVGDQSAVNVKLLKDGRSQEEVAAAGSGTRQTSDIVSVMEIGGADANNNNVPLYIIDGVSVSNQDASSLKAGDIATLEVLKDASATAIYGSKGANGVVIITTKKRSSVQEQ
ncbi:MAG: carboxypeptidase-like regulatory domain-containing protein [Tannerellaceae bacterium]|jgi:TonB-dependent SusC/RagA subfamily outer membrane receptor|nr:carboxypeptidase-like regulatory domain-containing protein [Tannerellaceae bacterium]